MIIEGSKPVVEKTDRIKLILFQLQVVCSKIKINLSSKILWPRPQNSTQYLQKTL